MEERAPAVPPEVILAVWEAEDGRCEACKRAMDKRWARVARIDDQGEATVDNLQLLCVDCKAHRPDLLRTNRLVLGEAVANRVLGTLAPEQLEGATRWLGQQLQRHGVIVMGGKKRRAYWLPGVGTFRIAFEREGVGTVEQVDHLRAQPQVRIKPQARTRGLPPPDRSPRPAKGSKPRKPAGRESEAVG